jgi:hypothetical protein
VFVINRWQKKQKAEPPFSKAARLSVKIRSFPSLSYGRFGFIFAEIF